ncbi:hypothetical protein [Parvularcula dongshanensis]|uniref:Uncharacterized protein n=1 Tax=Parvularcula dongshanensis TaxID=1173995 RepID=A0A840HZX9_9PROT|nr:hypothetical protein [Parvularcula dongshanensis]MBB4657522.1 hypothetical protein [Parvularcula dongshanensis]
MIFAAIIQVEETTDAQMAMFVELSEKYNKPEEAYGIVELFANCAASYRVEAELFEPDKPASAEFRRNLANGAEMVSLFIGSLHYDAPAPMTTGMIETRITQYVANFEMAPDEAVADLQNNLSVCVDASLFQKSVIDAMRQTLPASQN